jgi:membrane fusion protein (multidrug efflux system)
MTIVPVQAIYVEANFKETQIGLMRPGQPATIEADALPGVEFRGHVESLTPGTGATFSLVPPQNATGNFTKIVQRVPVRIRLDAGPEARRVLAPGLSLRVAVDTVSARNAIHRIHDEETRARP